MTYNLSCEYIAGFFDGEGCITSSLIYKTGKYEKNPWVSVHVSIAQKDRSILDKIQSLYGGTVREKGDRKNKRKCFHLVITGKENMTRFLTAIYPYSIVKKDQISVALEFIETLRTENLGPVSLSDNIHAIRKKVHNALRKLKQSVTPDSDEGSGVNIG